MLLYLSLLWPQATLFTLIDLIITQCSPVSCLVKVHHLHGPVGKPHGRSKTEGYGEPNQPGRQKSAGSGERFCRHGTLPVRLVDYDCSEIA